MAAARRTFAAAILALLALSARGASIREEMQAVERIRGLSFLGPVRTVELNRAELPAHLRQQFEKTLPYSTEDWVDVLRALRLVDQGTTAEPVVSSLIKLYESQVLAYYDPPSKTFYTVRGLPDAVKDLPMASDLDAGVAVHELTHALQDQHFAIGARDVALRDDADASLAYHAVIEGEATLVMLAYMIEQSGGGTLDDIISNDLLTGALSAAASQQMTGGGPRYFSEMLKFPYVDGLRFVIEAYRHGGWKGLDRVYANPPRSTREILHPVDYFEHRFAPETFRPKPTVIVPRLLSVEHLGEWHWRFLAGASNAEGWLADRVTIAQNGFCEPTVLVETQWDSEEHARRFYDGYSKSLEDVGSIGVVNGQSVKVAYGADRALMERFLKP
jgi:hypothetical protein